MFVNGIAYPACTPGAVSVGAVYDSPQGTQQWQGCTDQTTAADQIVCFSQSGQALTMLAPGAWIQAAGVTQAGTSQAAPHVAGAAAVLAAAAPQPTLGLITDALTTGRPIVDQRNGVIRPRLDLELAASLFRCDGAAVTIRGTRGNDHLVGTPGDDVIAGLGGDDVIEGLDGRDRICGGPGTDRLDGGAGPDTLLGEDGDDTLKDGEYTCEAFCQWGPELVLTGDVLSGGAGRDRADYSHRTAGVELSLDGAANDGAQGEGDVIRADVEIVVGGSSGDFITGGAGDDTLLSGAGDDDVVGHAGADTIDCGPGTDFVHPDAQDLSIAGCEYVGNPFKER
jgi:Ca2+-binding RTX toxin-like protein